MKNHILRVNDALYLASVTIAGLSLTTIAIIIPWGIFGRYVLGTGSRWPEPVAILLVVVFTFLGAAAAYRANAHMAVLAFSGRLRGVAATLCQLGVQLLMGLVALFMLIWGIRLCIATWGQFNAALPGLRVGMAYAPIPIGAALTLVFVIERLVFGDQSQRRVLRLDPDLEPEEGVA